MKKFNDYFSKKLHSFSKSKMFKSKNNLIISIVALVECIILLGITTYSWIESESSLKIRGYDLPISDKLNYRFDVADGGADMVDLSTYFSPVAFYQFAQASSEDGRLFFFKKENLQDGTVQTAYRQGDTTDYNTSYYNFDFQVHNETSTNFNYYFSTANIFDVTSSKIEDESVLLAAEGAFRIAVTPSTNNTTTIYSRDGITCNAIAASNGIVMPQMQTKLTDSDYIYNGDNLDETYVFQSIAGSEDSTVNIKIWFEEKDTTYQSLTDEQKEALLGATVSIDLKFINSASNFQTFFFDDYTFSTLQGNEGNHVTTDYDDQKMYFYYNDGTKATIFPMTKTTSEDSALRWVTCESDGTVAPRVSDDMLEDLASNPTHGYFFYGTVNGDTPSTTYTWNITAPNVDDKNRYLFKALSITPRHNGTDRYYTGSGVWGKNLQMLYFRDMATGCTADAYNANSFQYITHSGQDHMYVNNVQSVNNATAMFYDANSELFKVYYPTEYITGNSLYFMYTSQDYITSAVTSIVFNALNAQANTDGNYIFTGLGYGAAYALESMPSGGAAGYGTWGSYEKISFSTELIDASINADYRYKINTTVSGTRHNYYLAKGENSLKYFAYVPTNEGTTSSNYIAFRRFDSYSTSQASATYNDNTKALRDGSSIYYATNTESTATGQWHVAVVVDGSTNNVINSVLSTVEGSKLEYSVDGGATYVAMTKIDNYRYITADFAGNVKNVNFKWTAYPAGNGNNEAVFVYGHDLNNGIYFNIIE